MLKRLGLVSAFLICGTALGAAPPRCTEYPRGTVLVYNYALASPAAVLEAERHVGRAFHDACIAVQWKNYDGPSRDAAADPWACRQDFPTCILLRIVDRAAEPSTREAVFATAAMPQAGTAPYATVLYPAVRSIGRKPGASEGVVLACAIAHELGHLLLGPGAHSDEGVMRRVWTARDFALALRGGLYFTAPQAQRMQAELKR